MTAQDDILQQDGRLITEPARSVRFALDDLLAGIRDDNLHDAVDTGAPVGREVW